MMGESSSMGGGSSEDTVSNADTTMNGDDIQITDENDGGGIDMDGLEGVEDFGSPLMGMADSVMSGIMSNQVRLICVVDNSNAVIVTPACQYTIHTIAIQHHNI